MSNLKVGSKARFTELPAQFNYLSKTECQIIEGLDLVETRSITYGYGLHNCYRVCAHDGSKFYCRPEFLRPLLPPADTSAWFADKLADLLIPRPEVERQLERESA